MDIETGDVAESGKRRSREAKVGRVRYTLQLIKEVQADVRDLKLMARTVFASLKVNFGAKAGSIETKFSFV